MDPNALHTRPIFETGFVTINLGDLERHFVEPYPTPRRRWLAAQLKLFVNELRSLGATGELWMDGSFTTTKPNPADIDLALMISPMELNRIDDSGREKLDHYSADEGRPYVRDRWGCDLYVVNRLSLPRRNYWKRRFSHHEGEENKKGIPVLQL